MPRRFAVTLLAACALAAGPAAAPASGSLTLVSVTAGGASGNGASTRPSIAGGGSLVQFESNASDLVAGDTDTGPDLFVRDIAHSATTLVDRLPGGALPAGGGRGSPISDSGLFTSFATSSAGTVYLRDLAGPSSTRVDIPPPGVTFAHPGSAQAVTPDGRIVLFTERMPNSTIQLWQRNLQSGTTTLVSVSRSGAMGNGSTLCAAMSDTGQVVAFLSAATNLSRLPDTNGRADVFVRDMSSGHTVRVDIGLGGRQANGASGCPTVSGDGRYVAYQSKASDLVRADTNHAIDDFVYDSATHRLRRVDVSTAGRQGTRSPRLRADSLTSPPALSMHGCYVAFASAQSGLVAGDTNGFRDVFVHSCVGHTTLRVSRTASGGQIQDGSFQPAISADGRFVAFVTSARLLPADANRTSDIYLVGPRF
jgi:Tol biopolymer transport system component